jgi:hypothetical protein
MIETSCPPPNQNRSKDSYRDSYGQDIFLCVSVFGLKDDQVKVLNEIRHQLPAGNGRQPLQSKDEDAQSNEEYVYARSDLICKLEKKKKKMRVEFDCIRGYIACLVK